MPLGQGLLDLGSAVLAAVPLLRPHDVVGDGVLLRLGMLQHPVVGGPEDAVHRDGYSLESGHNKDRN